MISILSVWWLFLHFLSWVMANNFYFFFAKAILQFCLMLDVLQRGYHHHRLYRFHTSLHLRPHPANGAKTPLNTFVFVKWPFFIRLPPVIKCYNWSDCLFIRKKRKLLLCFYKDILRIILKIWICFVHYCHADIQDVLKVFLDTTNLEGRKNPL